MVDQSREGGYRAWSKALDANQNALGGFCIRLSAYSLNMSGIFSIFAVGWVIALYVWLGGLVNIGFRARSLNFNGEVLWICLIF